MIHTCERCAHLPTKWDHMAKRGATWEEMKHTECSNCQSERERRNRLVAQNDPRIHRPPFLHAPYIHTNNDPKYHALLLRAVEEAKHHETGSKHILWMFAQDDPVNASELGKDAKQAAKKRNQWLQLIHPEFPMSLAVK